ncbi:MAG: ISNCY family transposase [Granulosicoccus sp.]
MRETRNAQASIFDFYAEHEYAQQLRRLSELLDKHPIILSLVERDFDKKEIANTGAWGLSLESILRCLLLKQILCVSYRQLAFNLSDSPSYRAFVRLRSGQFPGKSALQASVRKISHETLDQINHQLILHWSQEQTLSMDSLRIDSTVVDSNIAKPLDSQLLNDGVRVLSRMMATSQITTGVRHRFKDQRKQSKSLSFQIFHEKKPEKEALYPKLLACVSTTLKQLEKAIEKVREQATDTHKANRWISTVEHYRALLLKVVDQSQRRVFQGERVPAVDKIVSLFEPHTDIIVKAKRDVQYGHKINLATQADGFVTYLNIEDGNPSDKSLFLPVLDASNKDYGCVPVETVADGGYASQANVEQAREKGVDRAVFNKRCGLGYHQMGVKKKTFDRLRNFRAGVEGNISELKRAFGISKATWKGYDGFAAYVWSSLLSYNLVRMIRFSSA